MSKKKEVAPVEEKTIPSALQNKVSHLKELISIHDLLNQGTFPGYMNGRIASGLEYLAEQHKELLDIVKNDPDVYMLPEFNQPEENDDVS